MTKWDLYFSTIVGWSLHPGYTREGTKRITIEEAATMATKMVEEAEKWDGLAPLSPPE